MAEQTTTGQESIDPLGGRRLPRSLRRELLKISESIPVDDGGGASVLKMLLLSDLIVEHDLSRIVEIGVYRGRLMLPLARLMRALGRGEVVGIDPYSADAAVQRDDHGRTIDLVQWPLGVDWEKAHGDVCAAIETWGLAERARLIRMRSHDVAHEFATYPIELLHIDGNHDRDAVERDIALYLPHVAQGGFVVLDDASWPSVRPSLERLRAEHDLVFQVFDATGALGGAGESDDFAVIRVDADRHAEEPARIASVTRHRDQAGASGSAESTALAGHIPTVSLRDIARSYDMPVRDPEQRRPEPALPSAWRVAALRGRRIMRRRRTRVRLAYLDSTFPWERSGFRYHEAQALFSLRPDTLFFSLWDLTDPFPAPVHSLGDFPEIALAEGITDAYAVFSLFLEGICGLRPSGDSQPHPMEGPDLSATMRAVGVKLHGSIYPGGGFTATPDGLARAQALTSRLHTTFSYVPEVLKHVSGVTAVRQAFTETRFYAQANRRWASPQPLVCLFAADAPPRKGLDVALAAFNGLSASDFHLHVVGPHQHRQGELPAALATFHGWLSPAELRALHQDVHVFVSPVSAEPPGPRGSFQGVTDGFPTQAAADAMSSGCLLVSANPAADHRVLSPERHYIESPADPDILRDVLRELAADMERARGIAVAGSDRVRSRMDVREGMAEKLVAMGF